MAENVAWTYMEAVVARAVEEERRLREEACERALCTGVAGVAVVHAHLAVGPTTYFITRLVPYGHIYEFPGTDSWQNYIDNHRKERP